MSPSPPLHLKNLELPKPVAGQPAITAVKRTSLMLRDPRNAPDAADAAALEKIHQQLMNDEKPDAMIFQRVDRPNQPTEWRVYRPIATSKSCLVCHGDPEKFRPEVKAALNHLYPQGQGHRLPGAGIPRRDPRVPRRAGLGSNRSAVIGRFGGGTLSPAWLRHRSV
ncbi:MAG: DUF3365 domain-containing protein [Lacunisphaera sp.]